MIFLTSNQIIMVLTALTTFSRPGAANRFFEQTDMIGSEFESAEEWLQAIGNDLDDVEAVYRLDLSMQSAPVNVSEEVAIAWLDLHPYAKPAEFPPIVETSIFTRPTRLELDADGEADMANDMQRDREFA